MRYLIVANWSTLQHYKDRCPPWLKLYSDLLDPEKDLSYSALSDTSKLLLHHIWLMAGRLDNRIPLSDAVINRHRLNLQTKPDLAPLIAAGFVYEFEEADQVVLQPASTTLAEPEQAASKLLAARLHHASPRVRPRALTSVSSLSVSVSESNKVSAESDDDFTAVWSVYPRKIGRSSALRCYLRQAKTPGERADLAAAVENYKREIQILGRDEAHTLHGSTFFNKVWRDYTPGTWVAPTGKPSQPELPNPFADYKPPAPRELPNPFEDYKSPSKADA